MRSFQYEKLPEELFCSEIMNLVASIHEYKGKQDFYIAAKPDILKAMPELAKVESTGASNRIEGLCPADDRLSAIVRGKTEPSTPLEYEIAGYSEVFQTISENYDYILPVPDSILQMHRDLYHYNPSADGGNFKTMSNGIAGQNNGYEPLSEGEAPAALEALTKSFREAVAARTYDPLLLIPMFVLDFFCIRPFNVGNRRMSMLLSTLLLYRSGYMVGQYISVEGIIEKTRGVYHSRLEESARNWQEEKNSYLPFVKYYLEVVFSAYQEFASRLEYLQNRKLTKPERIKKLFDTTLKRVSKKKILEKCPDISMSTVEVTLSALLKEGYITKIGAGKNTSYIRRK